MAQNVYDDPEFFEGYAQLARSIDGLDGAPEWPTLRSMLPSVAGADVVDLGCGYGWFCRWAAEHGTRTVVGIDLSERMLRRALDDPGHRPEIEYRRVDLDAVELTSGSCDLVYSSLALHYVADLGRLVDVVAEALRPGGTFVCSVEHPIRTAPTSPGFRTDPDGRRHWPLTDYLVEGPRTLDWITDDVVKHHRTFASHVGALLHAGLTIDGVHEWCPSDADLEEHPDWTEELHRPSFLLVRSSRG